jgi:hypothetical protein
MNGHAQLAQLRSVEPQLSESEITRERLMLEEAVRRVEAEAAQRAHDLAHKVSGGILSTDVRRLIDHNALNFMWEDYLRGEDDLPQKDCAFYVQAVSQDGSFVAGCDIVACSRLVRLGKVFPELGKNFPSQETNRDAQRW